MTATLATCVGRLRLAFAALGFLLLLGGLLLAAAEAQRPQRTTLVPGPVTVHYADGTSETIYPSQLARLQIVTKDLAGKAIERVVAHDAYWHWRVSPPEWTPTVSIETDVYIATVPRGQAQPALRAMMHIKHASRADVARDQGSSACGAPCEVDAATLQAPGEGLFTLYIVWHSRWECTDPRGQVHSGEGTATFKLDYENERQISYSISGTLQAGQATVKQPSPQPIPTYTLAPASSVGPLPLSLVVAGGLLLILAAFPALAVERLCRL